MEIYIKLNKNSEFGYDWMNHLPFDPIDGIKQTRVEAEKEGIFVKELPQLDPLKSDKMPILKVDNTTLKPYYEYVDRPLTREQVIDENQRLMQVAIDDLIMGGMM